MDVKSSSTPPPADTASTRGSTFGAATKLVVALTVFLAGTVVAFVQQPKTDFLTPPNTLEWWKYPGAANAFSRIPNDAGVVRDMAVVPGTETIWVVGDAGLLLHSPDAGDCWERVTLLSGRPVPDSYSVPCARPEQGMELITQARAAIAEGKPEAPAEQGAPPYAVESYGGKRGTKEAPAAAVEGDAENPVEQRTLPDAAESDGGKRITPREVRPGGTAGESPAVRKDAAAVEQSTKEPEKSPQGIIGGGAVSEVPPLPPSKGAPEGGLKVPDFLSVQFFSENRGLILGADGFAFTSDDGGSTWDRVSIAEYLPVRLIVRFFLFGDGGMFLGNFGSTPVRLPGWELSPDQPLFAAQFLDRRLGFAVGAQGVILLSRDGGSWVSQASTTKHDLQSVHFIDREHGWAVGNRGAIVATVDGQNWKAQASGTDKDLFAVRFLDAQRGRVVAVDGTILDTRDGGRNWTAATDHPAPWYWLLSIVAIGLAVWGAREGTQPVQYTESVADMLASDRPLRPGERDALGFHEIAEGLADFLSNRNTEPPVTVAITGEWGTGKSSLMNLLHADLKRRGFTPVWFNAWHHQKGEQLLASLFAHIRSQAIPGLLSLSGWSYRGRLLVRRGWRNPIKFALLTILFMLTIPYAVTELWRFLLGVISVDTSHVTVHADRLFAGLERVVQLVTSGSADEFYKAMIGFAGGAPALVGLVNAIRGFGINPARLMTVAATDTGKAKPVDPGARAQFADEFRDVAECLDLGSVVIFIDDLDRCRRENVVEILETVNFLSVSGPCYIILGMAETWVERCVALEFNDLSPTEGTDQDEFARRYLEKLINIKVPVPKLSDDHSLSLLASEYPAESSMASELRALIRRYVRHWPLAAAVALVCTAWLLRGFVDLTNERREPIDLLTLSGRSDISELVVESGDRRIVLSRSSAATIAAESAGAENPVEFVLRGSDKLLEEGLVLETFGDGDTRAQLVMRSPKKPAGGTGQGAPRSAGSAGPQDGTAAVAAARLLPGTGVETGPRWTEILVILAAFVAAGAYMLLRRPARFTSDSSAFKTALKVWSPWVIAERRTPRTIKRFQNRLRYLAMRYRPRKGKTNLLERVHDRFRAGSSPDGTPASEGANSFEPTLVALGSIHHVEPAWIVDDEMFPKVCQGEETELAKLLARPQVFSPNVEENLSLARKLCKSIVEHRDRFPWPPDENDRRRFLHIIAEAIAEPAPPAVHAPDEAARA